MKRHLIILLVILSALPVSATAQEVGLNTWMLNESADEITDEREVSAGIATDNGLLFTFHCQSDKFGAVIIPYTAVMRMEFITMEETTDVSWRVDSLPAVTETWQVVRGKAGSSYFVMSIPANEFAMTVLGGDEKLAFRVYGITTSVSLDGAHAVVTSVLEACGVQP